MIMRFQCCLLYIFPVVAGFGLGNDATPHRREQDFVRYRQLQTRPKERKHAEQREQDVLHLLMLLNVRAWSHGGNRPSDAN